MAECEECSDVAEQYTLPAIGLSVVVATVVYAAVSSVMRGTVDPVEVGMFAVFFGVFYVLYLKYVGDGVGTYLPIEQ